MLYFSLLLISLSIFTTSGAQGQTPTSAEEYSQRGIARFEKNDLDGAISDFTKAVELNGPNQEFCYYFRGMAHYRQGNLDVAIADISKAITIKQHPRFYDDRGNLLVKKGDLDGAIADLNKAIELAPQYAKAYGARGIARLMRGENTQAELDFKKCFELDSTLQTQINAAASQIRQNVVSSHEPEQPSDVKVIKFTWSELPARMLTAPSPTIAVSSTGLSQTGTRVLAPADNGDPGRPNVGLDADMNPSGSRGSNATTKVSEEKFTVLIHNIGDKTIVGVRWRYSFYPKDLTREPTSFVFSTKTNIGPGKEKTVSEQGFAPTDPGHRIQMPNQKTRMLFNERVAILHLDYADGSVWPAPQP
ncbi:MAG: tetratricopeptide repeat protein [bacterium]